MKDSFSFCADLQEFGHVGDNVFMCSFDVVSLFTNVPIDEAIQICLDTYRSDIKQPKISEQLLKKLLYKATRDVEFSFNDSMFRQVDHRNEKVDQAIFSLLSEILTTHLNKFCQKFCAQCQLRT